MRFCHPVDDDLELVLLERRHASALFALVDAHRPYLRRWLPWVDATRSPDDTAGFIQTTLDQLAAGRGFQTGIRHRGALVGMIGFHPIDWARRQTAIGYWLAESAQGQGLMTRACRAYLDHAFGELGLKRVEIRVAPANARSRAVPTRLGFREEGIIKDAEWLYDHHVDHVVYAMAAEDWPTPSEG